MEPADKDTKPVENPVIANDADSDKQALAGEGKIGSYDEILHGHPALEDVDEISSTEDV